MNNEFWMRLELLYKELKKRFPEIPSPALSHEENEDVWKQRFMNKA